MKIGFLSMPIAGHLNPMTALGRTMQGRGHEVTFFGLSDAACIVQSAGLDFVPFGREAYPLGATPAMYAHLATLKGEDVTRYSFQEMHPRRTKITLEQLPRLLALRGIEAMVVDTIHFFAELVPLSMGIPYAHIWNVLHVDSSGATPPCFFGWEYEDSPSARARNTDALKRIALLFQPIQHVAQAWAAEHGLQIDWKRPEPTISQLAVITQTPKEFDFPNVHESPAFHYAGPFHDESGRETVPFPWERLTGEPLIYASMGTLVNGLTEIFRVIIEVATLISGRQLVLSIGSNVRIEELGPIPANAIVVSRAPQIELLKRSDLCITHAGINTTLESLSLGVPMVAIPVGFDQPGIAARIVYHGVGERVPVSSMSKEALSKAVQAVMGDPSYRDKARQFQKAIAESSGLDLAADVLERAFQRAGVPGAAAAVPNLLHVFRSGNDA
ncbi:glycosyltransferase [Acidipila sp. EB88]|uniref:glycosyltransferase n=1 Tax=Acidipila sp. EB88 TaxID=2305226 RepID=UPI000F5DDCE5|nr:nucleotide disphospho-sugar-binding domain-containing protein [Acidipila sp. EB88]RRA47685.1 glycosyl transferase [Acidipila sp. EB88]